MNRSKLVCVAFALLTVVVSAISCGGAALVVPDLPGRASSGLRIYHIDVEQADATLFVAPSGNTLLVDSGKDGHGSRVKAVMDAAGVVRIDHFVATHYHEDHYGGIDDLVLDDGVTVARAYDRGAKERLKPAKRAQRSFRGYQAAIGNRAVALYPGYVIQLDANVTVTCISSSGRVSANDPLKDGDENDLSVALLVEYAGFRYFVGGDVHSHTEARITHTGLIGEVDVYQANHHGSHTSSSVPFMRALSPTAIVISNGSHGGHKHPRAITLETYRALERRPTVFQTNRYNYPIPALPANPTAEQLAGVAANVPDEFIADLEQQDHDGTIVVVVQPSTASFSVFFSDYAHTFPIKSLQALDSGRVVITQLLPNPVGDDSQLEEVRIKNNGSEDVSLAGWALRDNTGAKWSLSQLGSMAPGATKTIVRSGMAMSLNNDGDTIEVVRDDGSVADRIVYPSVAEGQWIVTGH